MGEYNIKVAAPWHDQLKVWIPFSMFAFLLISMGIRAGYLVQSVRIIVVSVGSIIVYSGKWRDHSCQNLFW